MRLIDYFLLVCSIFSQRVESWILPDSYSSLDSLEDAYEALRTFEILGIGKDLDISTSTCTLITETFKDSSASLKDINFALKSNRALKCKVDEENFKVQFLSNFMCFRICIKDLFVLPFPVVGANLWISECIWGVLTPFLFSISPFSYFLKAVSSTLQAAITKANSLLDFYYSVGSLLLLKVINHHFVNFFCYLQHQHWIIDHMPLKGLPTMAGTGAGK